MARKKSIEDLGRQVARIQRMARQRISTQNIEREERVGEIFLRYWDNIDKTKGGRNLRTWLDTTAGSTTSEERQARYDKHHKTKHSRRVYMGLSNG